MAEVLNKTEFMIFYFYQRGILRCCLVDFCLKCWGTLNLISGKCAAIELGGCINYLSTQLNYRSGKLEFLPCAVEDHCKIVIVMHQCSQKIISPNRRLHFVTMDAAMLPLLLSRCSDIVNVYSLRIQPESLQRLQYLDHWDSGLNKNSSLISKIGASVSCCSGIGTWIKQLPHLLPTCQWGSSAVYYSVSSWQDTGRTQESHLWHHPLACQAMLQRYWQMKAANPKPWFSDDLSYLNNFVYNTNYNVAYEMTIHDNAFSELLIYIWQYQTILYNICNIQKQYCNT
jgi:hypothetical protein